jgi:hypothetical protein
MRPQEGTSSDLYLVEPSLMALELAVNRFHWDILRYSSSKGSTFFAVQEEEGSAHSDHVSAYVIWFGKVINGRDGHGRWVEAHIMDVGGLEKFADSKECPPKEFCNPSVGVLDELSEPLNKAESDFIKFSRENLDQHFQSHARQNTDDADETAEEENDSLTVPNNPMSEHSEEWIPKKASTIISVSPGKPRTMSFSPSGK